MSNGFRDLQSASRAKFILDNVASAPMDVPLLDELREAVFESITIELLTEDTWRRMAAQHTFGSNAIEGRTLSLEEVETLVVRGDSVGGHPVKEVMEAVQHGNALMGLRRRSGEPMTAGLALDLHDQVFRGVLPGAGQWREVNSLIVGSSHRPPSSDRVGQAMTEWEQGYRERCRDQEPVFALAAWMHHRFEAIHPFVGGNGQVGRLLMDLHFLKNGWPPVCLLPEDRERYFSGLEAGHDGDLGGLEEILTIAMSRSLLDLLDLEGREEDALRPIDQLETRGPGFVDFLMHQAEVGNLPSVSCGNGWCTSQRALALFNSMK